MALNRTVDAGRLAEELIALGPDLHYSLAAHGLVAERQGQTTKARDDWEKTLNTPDCPYPAKRDATFGLARLHVAANRREAARRRYREAMKLVDDAWAGLRTDDSRLTFLTGAMDLYQDFDRALIRWGDDAEALQLEESSRARLLGDHDGHAPEPVANAEALIRLGRLTHSVFLAYWLAPDGGSHVRVVTSTGAKRIPLPGAEPREITRLVREHNELIELQSGDPRTQGTAAIRLYDLIVKPVEAQIPAGSRVALIPDGALHRLNFETLVRVKDGQNKFWIEDVVLQIAPSLSLLSVRPAVAAGTQRLLLIGNPLAAPEFNRLDHAAAEMKTIKDLFSGGAVTELSAEAATPSAYAASSPGAHSHIHFTAHAKADRESPLNSAVILTPETAPGGGEKRYRLLARDVAAIKLEADLVTVSACRSAGDRAVSGEGMVGFAWAFQKAGAAHVVAGLWDVNDRSTASLMAELYKAIRAGEPVTEALRAAKLSFIIGGKNYAKPYYWAPFQVYSRSLPNGNR